MVYLGSIWDLDLINDMIDNHFCLSNLVKVNVMTGSTSMFKLCFAHIWLTLSIRKTIHQYVWDLHLNTGLADLMFPVLVDIYVNRSISMSMLEQYTQCVCQCYYVIEWDGGSFNLVKYLHSLNYVLLQLPGKYIYITFVISIKCIIL